MVLPEIETFASDKANVPLGDSVSLFWSIKGAEKLVISPIPGNVNSTTTAGEGSTEIILPKSAIYTLNAFNEYGKATARVEILVDDKTGTAHHRVPCNQ